MVPPVFSDETAVGTVCGAAAAPAVPVAAAAVGVPPVAARVAVAAPALVAETGTVVLPRLLLLLPQPARPSAMIPEVAAPARSTLRRLTLSPIARCQYVPVQKSLMAPPPQSSNHASRTAPRVGASSPARRPSQTHVQPDSESEWVRLLSHQGRRA